MNRAILCACVLLLVGTNPSALFAIDGVLSVGTEAETPVYLRAWAPGAAATLTGVSFYNNDGTAPATKVWVMGADESGRPDWENAVGYNCSSLSGTQQWVDVDVSDLELSAGERVWVGVEFPSGNSDVESGVGGGAALGYTHQTNSPVDDQLVSPDGGTEYYGVKGEYALAIDIDLDEAPQNKTERGDSSTSVTHAALLRATPNPFNPRTSLSYRVEAAGDVQLTVYNLRGQRVRTLFEGPRQAGGYEAIWDGSDSQGNAMSSGVYFVRLTQPGKETVERVALVR